MGFSLVAFAAPGFPGQVLPAPQDKEEARDFKDPYRPRPT